MGLMGGRMVLLFPSTLNTKLHVEKFTVFENNEDVLQCDI
jgi:hypothetical protein